MIALVMVTRDICDARQKVLLPASRFASPPDPGGVCCERGPISNDPWYDIINMIYTQFYTSPSEEKNTSVVLGPSRRSDSFHMYCDIYIYTLNEYIYIYKYKYSMYAVLYVHNFGLGLALEPGGGARQGPAHDNLNEPKNATL
jgi:hypothetical protein